MFAGAASDRALVLAGIGPSDITALVRRRLAQVTFGFRTLISDLPICGGSLVGAEAKQGLEGRHGCAASVVAERELVQVDL